MSVAAALALRTRAGRSHPAAPRGAARRRLEEAREREGVEDVARVRDARAVRRGRGRHEAVGVGRGLAPRAARARLFFSGLLSATGLAGAAAATSARGRRRRRRCRRRESSLSISPEAAERRRADGRSRRDAAAPSWRALEGAGAAGLRGLRRRVLAGAGLRAAAERRRLRGRRGRTPGRRRQRGRLGRRAPEPAPRPPDGGRSRTSDARCTSVVVSLIESRRSRAGCEVCATSAATARVPAFACIGLKTRARSSQTRASGPVAPSWIARSSTFSARSASPRRSSVSPSQR